MHITVVFVSSPERLWNQMSIKKEPARRQVPIIPSISPTANDAELTRRQCSQRQRRQRERNAPEKLPTDSQAKRPPVDDQAYEHPAHKLIDCLCTIMLIGHPWIPQLKSHLQKTQYPNCPLPSRRPSPIETTTDLLAEETVTPT